MLKTRTIPLLFLTLLLPAAPLSVAQGAKDAVPLAAGGNYGSCQFRTAGQVIFTRFDFEKGGEIIFQKELPAGTEKELGPGTEPDLREPWLAYVGTQPGQEGLWLHHLATGKKQRLTTHLADHNPVLLPDGKGVIFSSFRDDRLGLFQADIATGTVQRLPAENAIQPAVAPDGQTVAFVRQNQLWTLDLKSMRETQLTRNGDNFSPSFSPDGAQLAYVEQSIQPLANVALLELRGLGKQLLTAGGTEARSPRFTPDGAALIYIGLDAQKENGVAAGNAIWRLRLPKPAAKQVTVSP